MKELSIEEKAKAYDEAIEKAKDYHKQLLDEDNPEWASEIEKIFPELKENEDEKIRKALIRFHKSTIDIDGIKSADVIAWLEKQKAVDVLDEEEREFADHVDSYRKEVDAAYQKGYNEGVKATLEKQGEQKTTIEMKTPEESLSIDSDTYNKIVDECIYGEQKPADKVEPKFHVNEWVVTYKNDVVQIKAVNNGYYTIHNGMDFNMSYVDRCWHKWTIQDAKDGDVLTYNDSKNNVWVCIFKEYVNERVYDYCTLDKESFWERSNWNYLASFSYTPATKEQRDTLMKAMADAGYTFDFESKELKKIESTNIPENFEKYVEHLLSLSDGEGHGSPAKVKEVSAKLLKLAKLEQKPVEWSEEDSQMVTCLIITLQYAIENSLNDNFIKQIKEQKAWLKSLKDRVRPQQEWSEEDEKMFNSFLHKLEVCDLLSNKEIIWIKDKLKSLRPQNTWKPSDEQMKALKEACDEHWEPLRRDYGQRVWKA